MTISFNQFHDAETLRQQRNLTRQQKKNNSDTKEGVLVNNFIKDGSNKIELNLNDTRDSLVISDNVKMPERLNEQETSKEKSIVPISAAQLQLWELLPSLLLL